jgi:hypothetical protein
LCGHLKEVLRRVLMNTAVNDSVLPSAIGGTLVLITPTVKDGPASVVVPTGGVSSPRVLQGGITSVVLLSDVVLTPLVMMVWSFLLL